MVRWNAASRGGVSRRIAFAPERAAGPESVVAATAAGPESVVAATAARPESVVAATADWPESVVAATAARPESVVAATAARPVTAVGVVTARVTEVSTARIRSAFGACAADRLPGTGADPWHAAPFTSAPDTVAVAPAVLSASARSPSVARALGPEPVTLVASREAISRLLLSVWGRIADPAVGSRPRAILPRI
jgi:hypothetical protein